jgi:hypothetical protein
VFPDVAVLPWTNESVARETQVGEWNTFSVFTNRHSTEVLQRISENNTDSVGLSAPISKAYAARMEFPLTLPTYQAGTGEAMPVPASRPLQQAARASALGFVQ